MIGRSTPSILPTTLSSPSICLSFLWNTFAPSCLLKHVKLTPFFFSIVNMPEIIAQTNMDSQSIARLKEELTKFCTWLSRNSPKYFVAKYEKPSAEYIEAAR